MIDRIKSRLFYYWVKFTPTRLCAHGLNRWYYCPTCRGQGTGKLGL